MIGTRLRGLLAALALTVPLSAWAGDLADVKGAGILRVAVYKEFPPFSDDGKGIDVDLAKALAEKLGVKAEIVVIDAQENMDDDLRIWIWKGAFSALGVRMVDVMMHVPIDRTFAERNPQVKIFSPYYRETMAVVRNLDRVRKLEGVTDFGNAAIGVEADTIADMVILAADAGRLRNNVHHYLDLDAVPADLKGGKIDVFFGTRSQAESMSADVGEGFAMSAPPPMPSLPQAGWTQGIAVKADYVALGEALQKAMDSLDAEGRLDAIFRQHRVTRLKPLSDAR